MNKIISKLSVILGVFIVLVVVANADTTFRAHFNDTGSWDINTVNGDYSTGSGTATVSGAPMWDTGFFPGSSPANKAFYVTNATPYVRFPANDGNVPIYNPTSSVMTVGFWCKVNGDLKTRPVMIRSGGFEDWVMFDFGINKPGQWTVAFHDNGVNQNYSVFSFIGTDYITNWMYFAATIDLGKKQITAFQYDNTGVLLSKQTLSILVDSWGVTNGAAIIQFNYSLGANTKSWIDEFTIDDRALSQSEMRIRMDKMISGTQLSDDDSFGPAAPGVPPGPTNITFLAHFNDSANRGLDLNMDNGDFYGGNYMASFTDTPTWTTGFFAKAGASIPTNRALASTVTYDADDGNVNYISPTSGGITVGCWVKNPTDAIGDFFRIGSSDYVRVDYGQQNGKKVRTIFHDTNYPIVVNSTALTGKIQNWAYIAVTVDLTTETLTQYQYDNTGAIVGTPASMTIPIDNWDVKNAGSYIEVSGSSSIMIDEFTIFNYVLTQSELEKLVQKMVNGREINYQPPAGMFMVIK